MRHIPLHDLSEAEFEDLVIAICRELLGVGVTGFAKGPDGGRDGFSRVWQIDGDRRLQKW